MELTDLSEAKISHSKVGAAMGSVVSYIERALGVTLRKLGTDHFTNSAEHGFGVRYLEDGTLNCLRFNWEGSSSKEIVSVDMWNGTSHDPQYNIAFKGISLAKALPDLVRLLKKPKVGHHPVTGEVALAEAKKGEFSGADAIKDMIAKLEAGRSFNRSEFIMAYHPENAHAYDEWVENNKDQLVLSGKRISIPKGTKFGDAKAAHVGAHGELIVTRGGNGEEYEVETPAPDRISFADSLEHLEGLATVLIKGSTNALFVAGRGGTGKTQTIEDVLAAHGLTDGDGYFKITGSASPIGIYTMLYKYRTGIVMFDDCDGALESQDGRNIIKAATDTKKIRKVAWGKKSSGMFDPDDEPEEAKKASAAKDAGEASDEDEDQINDLRIPKHFNFTGRVIFISNMPLNKLDPDGALRTRAFVINIDPTPDEMFERMGQILHHVKLEQGSLSKEEREEVMKVVRTSRRAKDASLRTLVRGLNLAASGAPNWKKLVELYA